MAPRKKTSEMAANSAEALATLLDRARTGDKTTLPALWKAFDDPFLLEVYGNLASQAQHAFVNAVAGDNLAFREGLTCKLEVLRADLAGPNPTPIERLLVERVVACWLQVQDADVRYAHAKELTWKGVESWQRRMDHCHRRYLSALKTLALVRKLAVPVVQVNIAKKQVNVAGPVLGNNKEVIGP